MKILLLGSGELGKEFVIAAQRLGQHVVAADRYAGAPAMQVAHEFEVIDMLNGEDLDKIVEKHKPDIIVPEIEAIRTERLYSYEKKGIQVVPSAKAVNFTMDRRAIRDLAAQKLGLRTARYEYASNMLELQKAILKIGFPCVVKPLMSSSGKGQSVVREERDISIAWTDAAKGRGDTTDVIVEAFVNFHTEITLLTITQKEDKTLFCAPIGHRQERGDYQESWQPVAGISDEDLKEAQRMARLVTAELGGAGLWGVEFFLANDGVYFSELSPRPHDTGMVTLAGTQNLTQFELHLRAVLGLPIPEIKLLRAGASAVILGSKNIDNPSYVGIDKALKEKGSDVRIFGKPAAHLHRRMGVALFSDSLDADMKGIREQAKSAADKVKIKAK